LHDFNYIEIPTNITPLPPQKKPPKQTTTTKNNNKKEKLRVENLFSVGFAMKPNEIIFLVLCPLAI
jgi:hypothetical protein